MSTHHGAGEHVVHFYRDDLDLCSAVTRFILEGVERRERSIVLVTEMHWRAICESLKQSGHESATRQVTFVDADATLRDIMVDGVPNTQRFAEAVQQVIADAHPHRVRIFGELVTLLAQRGALDAALEIERVGHQLTASTGCQVLCAYDLYHLDTAGEDVQRVAAAHHRAVPELPSGRLGAKTILIADDYEDTRDLYREYLLAHGYRVITAESGHEAIRAAKTWRPDVVLMDIRMPDITGVDAMLALKRDPHYNNAPIVAFTANASENTRVECLAAGFAAVIVKPCLPDALLEQIRQYFSSIPDVEGSDAGRLAV